MAEAREPQTSTTARVRVVRMGGSGPGARGDHVIVEEPLQVFLEHRGHRAVLGSTLRTPGHDLELAVGLAVGEGVIAGADDLVSVRPCRDGRGPQANGVTVVVADHVEIDLGRLGRVARPSSACGLCGREEIEVIVATAPRVRRDVVVAPDVIAALPESMREQQTLFRRTGGPHAAALASSSGEITVVREDVGRHNAVDKVIGRAVMDSLVADVLMVSGRAGFEIVQKAAMAGVPVVASVSAPTSLSVEVAQACGITLVAFVRDGRLNVYSGGDRLRTDDAAAATS